MTNLEAVKALVRSMGDDATMLEAIKVGVLAILEDMEPGTVPEKEQKPKPEKKQEPKPKKAVKEFDIGKTKALREGGWTLAGIAKELGCSQQTVANQLHKAGVK